jgi:preprotein translocase subunit SecG
MLWLTYTTMFLLLIIGILLIFIVLLQRGRGGGLAGALGGMGGQSAFGTKAGDLFTRITVVLAVIWIVLCAGQIPLLRAVNSKFKPGGSTDTVIQTAPGDEDEQRNPFDGPADGDADRKNADDEMAPDTKKFPDDADKTDEKSETDTPDDLPAEPKSDENDKPKSESESKSDEKPTDEKPTDDKPQE